MLQVAGTLFRRVGLYGRTEGDAGVRECVVNVGTPGCQFYPILLSGRPRTRILCSQRPLACDADVFTR